MSDTRVAPPASQTHQARSYTIEQTKTAKLEPGCVTHKRAQFGFEGEAGPLIGMEDY